MSHAILALYFRGHVYLSKYIHVSAEHVWYWYTRNDIVARIFYFILVQQTKFLMWFLNMILWLKIEIKRACKDIGLAVNTGKTKYMEVGCYRGMMANGHIRIGNNSHEKVKTFKLFIPFIE